MSVVMNFAMFPTRKESNMSPYVSRIVKRVRESGHQSQLTAMGTLVETETLTQALKVIEEAYAVLEPDCDRVYLTVNIDIKKGPTGRINSKVESVEEKIVQNKHNH